jgi:hypothetical protein
MIIATPKPAKGMQPFYFVGLELGQTEDFTALCVDEVIVHGGTPHHSIRHLERFKLGTLYPAIVRRVAELFTREALKGGFLIVDGTGVGRAVVDLLRGAPIDCKLFPCTITAGQGESVDEQGYIHIAKKELVGTAQMLLQTGRLAWSAKMPLADVLAKELSTFRVKITAAANETFEAWREHDHDDLVLAILLAAWVAEQFVPELAEEEGEPEVTVIRV